MDEWIKKMWHIYTVEYYSAMKKEIVPFVITWMNLESIMLSEINQTEKDKCCIVSLTHGINKKSWFYRNRIECFMGWKEREMEEKVLHFLNVFNLPIFLYVIDRIVKYLWKSSFGMLIRFFLILQLEYLFLLSYLSVLLYII